MHFGECITSKPTLHRTEWEERKTLDLGENTGYFNATQCKSNPKPNFHSRTHFSPNRERAREMRRGTDEVVSDV
jgi:hypothetical protein